MNGKKTLNKIGVLYGGFAMSMLALQLLMSAILLRFFYDFTKEHSIALSLGMTFLVEHVICFGLLLLFIKKIPKVTIVKKKFGVGMAISAFCIMYALMEAGALVGNYLQISLTGDTMNDATQLLMSSDMLPRIFVIGICAPIVEELIFRKLLIDRLIKYGVGFSIVMSGLMFGLIHGNFSQFFYAFLLGSFFAAIYIKTGKIQYTIAYHMIVNVSSSVIGVWVLNDYNVNGMNSIPYMIYSIFIFATAIAGVVLLIVKYKKFVPRKEEIEFVENVEEPIEKLSFSDVFTSWGMILYFVMMVVMFLVQYGVINIL